MSTAPLSTSAPRRFLATHRGVLIAAIVFIILLGTVDFISAGPLTYFDITFLSSGGATSALAAIGQTHRHPVRRLRPFGRRRHLAGQRGAGRDPWTRWTWTPMCCSGRLVGIGIGMLTGAFNGFFIALLRLQPIVVTLSTMFIIQGVTLLVMDKPGGSVSPSLGTFYMGDAITGWLPMPLVVIGVVLLAWLWLKNTRLGIAIYAVGSDPDAAAAVGVRVALVRFLVYVIAGGCYGLAGVFISAQTGSGDPLVGNPLLLSMFAAVVVGGTRLGGGRGGPLGSAIGAYILMIVVNILLVLNVSAYYSTIAEGTILILAVLAGSLSRHSTLAKQLRMLGTRMSARRAGTLVSQLRQNDMRLSLVRQAKPLGSASLPSFFVRHAEITALCAAGLYLLHHRGGGNADLARQRHSQPGLLELAHRPFLLSRHPGAGTGHGDPHRRT